MFAVELDNLNSSSDPKKLGSKNEVMLKLQVIFTTTRTTTLQKEQKKDGT